jgi:hypothetical protein
MQERCTRPILPVHLQGDSNASLSSPSWQMRQKKPVLLAILFRLQERDWYSESIDDMGIPSRTRAGRPAIHVDLDLG